MDLQSRLKKAEDNYQLNRNLFEVQDFSNWNNEQLFTYIKDSIERTHKEQGIKSYKDAERYYNYIRERETITEEERKLYLEIDKDYWDGKYKS